MIRGLGIDHHAAGILINLLDGYAERELELRGNDLRQMVRDLLLCGRNLSGELIDFARAAIGVAGLSWLKLH